MCCNISGLEFDHSTHTYTMGGTIVPSVTQVISEILNPYLNENYFLEKARKYGTAVHKMTELYDLGKLNKDTLDERLKPVLNAWIEFVSEYKMKFDFIEAKCMSKKYMYAGTVDRVGNDILIDIKTSKKRYLSGLQLSAYFAMLKENGVKLESAMIVSLGKNGYSVMRYPEDEMREYFEKFKVLLKAYEIKRELGGSK